MIAKGAVEEEGVVVELTVYYFQRYLFVVKASLILCVVSST